MAPTKAEEVFRNAVIVIDSLRESLKNESLSDEERDNLSDVGYMNYLRNRTIDREINSLKFEKYLMCQTIVHRGKKVSALMHIHKKFEKLRERDSCTDDGACAENVDNTFDNVCATSSCNRKVCNRKVRNRKVFNHNNAHAQRSCNLRKDRDITLAKSELMFAAKKDYDDDRKARAKYVTSVRNRFRARKYEFQISIE